jgi:hypothetical protein
MLPERAVINEQQKTSKNNNTIKSISYDYKLLMQNEEKHPPKGKVAGSSPAEGTSSPSANCQNTPLDLINTDFFTKQLPNCSITYP